MPTAEHARPEPPRRSSRRRAARLHAAALALLVASSATGARPYVLEHDGRTTELEVRASGRRELVDAEQVARAFGLELVRDRKRVELRGPEGTIAAQVGRAMVFVDEQPLLLSAEVEQDDRRIWVPLDFVTRAVARLVGAQPRHDGAARAIRFDAPGGAVTCERFADRTRVTVKVARPPELSEVLAEGRRRIVTLRGQELPAQVGGCTFDETLADLEVRPGGGATTLTFFVGPAFGRLEVSEVPADGLLVLDFIDQGAAAAEEPVADGGAASVDPDRFDVVVIDAGHGGADDGARGPGGLREKDLTLAVALELARRLREEPGLEVIVTRESDAEVGLLERTEIANRARADLFMSIHANATPAGPAHGAETYFLDVEGTDAASRTLAALENDATGLRGRGGGGGDVEIVLWDLAQQQYLAESSQLAETVQRELNVLAGTRDRGVKQANFLVLRGATMPAVLVEVGFLSNPAEEKKMRGAAFREATAEALHRAIVAFRDQRAARSGP